MENNMESVIEKKDNNKKLIVLSIVAVAALVVAILGTTYAMFTAELEGQQENVLNTGYVKMNCAETTFNLEGINPMTDDEGIAATDNVATCTLTTDMNGSMIVGYDVALYDVDVDTPSDALNTSNVKAQFSKKVGAGEVSYLGGSTATTGVTFASLADTYGQYDYSIDGYVVDSATVSSTQSVVYTVKSWVSSDYVAPENTTTNTPAACTDIQYTTKETCEAANEIWGPLQTESQAGASFSFKLKVGATQVFATE